MYASKTTSKAIIDSKTYSYFLSSHLESNFSYLAQSFTETEGNLKSMFCYPETVDVSGGEPELNPRTFNQ